MTREEAIKEMIRSYDVLDFSCHMDNRRKEAFNMAKVALEQEPSGETVSLEAFKQVMRERDIAIGQLKELGYGFGQKIEPCDDAISRQAVFEQIDQWAIGNREYLYTNATYYLTKRIQNIPPVTPQVKTGHWIRVDKDKLKCSECDVIHFIAQYPQGKIAWCPNCGARMFEPQESEDKE